MAEHPLATMKKLDPEFMKHIDATDALVYTDGALPRKVKLLMAMAFDAAEGAAGGVRALAEQAMKAGATKEEIAEALRVAFHLSGVGSLYAASFGLKDILG
ncbi:MAG: carboxymuconolactone decarboxylase family protein [Candidatus Aminicenantes bacterium]|jgi:alkylhydroperoxidase/carboxymuconolactone decarboxylase family protein YurZ|nr:carboxymuconolactone decarboxylase family protein [Candidatus Aminicenantes bacterium]